MGNELAKRLISAAFLGVIVLAATWYGGIGFRAVVALCAIVIFYEWVLITQGAPSLRSAAGARINLFAWLMVVVGSVSLLAGRLELALFIGILGGVFTCAWGLLALKNVWSGLGVFYALLPAFALVEVRGSGAQGILVVFFLFGVVWATDVVAYFSGRYFAGPKLAPRISPSKTWSGAVCGTIGAVVAGTSVAFFADGGAHLWIALLALGLSIVSQLGDLFESWVKRRFGAKDSSHLIPGHGGLMDRIDGLVFAAFAAYLLAVLMSAAVVGQCGFSDIDGAFWTPAVNGSAPGINYPFSQIRGVGSWI